MTAYLFSNSGNDAFEDDCEATSCLKGDRALEKA